MAEETNEEIKRMSFLVRDFQAQIETLTSKMNEMIGEINGSQAKIKSLESWKADHEKKELIQGQARFDSPGQQHMDPYRAEQMRNVQAQQAMMGAPQMAQQQMSAPQMMPQQAAPQHAMPSSSSTRAPDNTVSIEKMFYFGNKK